MKEEDRNRTATKKTHLKSKQKRPGNLPKNEYNKNGKCTTKCNSNTNHLFIAKHKHTGHL